MKKLLAICLSCVIISISLYLAAFAANEVDIYSPETKSNTKYKFVNVKRPSGDETIFGNNYVVCGIAVFDNVHTRLLRYNLYTKKYVDFSTKNNISEWDINESGIFMKEVGLPYGEINKLRLVFYKDGNDDIVQIEDYTINVLQDNMKDYVRSSLLNYDDMMWYLDEID